MMVYWRDLVVKLKIHWRNLRHLVQPYLNYDYDRCLDLIMIGAGIRPVAGAEPWKRNCLILYRLLGFYQFMMSIANVIFSIRSGNGTFELCASMAILVTMIASCAKAFILGHYDEVVRQSKTFVDSNYSFSGDPDYDATVRRDRIRVAGKVTLIIFVILCCDELILSIPNSARDSIFGIPEQFHVLGPMTTRLLQEAFVFMIGFFWGCRYFSSPLTIIPLLTGLKHELMIVAHGYETVAALDDDQINATGTLSGNLLRRRLSGNLLKQKLGVIVEQHVEVLRILHLVQPLISYLYAIIYYGVMIIVSLLAFVVIRSEITVVSLVIIGVTGIILIVECYFWCRMIESIEETMEMIADCVARLGSGLQHSVDNHSQYIEMRTSIMIIQLNASQYDWFSCGGIFPISVESYGNLCMIIYKFSTFLLEF